MKKLKNKVIVITGGSRGIGLAIALRLAADGAKIAILAKTDQLNPKLPGTIYTAANSIVEAGGKALPIKCDIRDEKQVADAYARVICEFGGIDVLINNASAISLTDTSSTDMKKFDLMQAVNGRGTYLCSKLAIPHLRKSKNPHILTLSPPLNLNPQWFGSHLAYTISKYTMSMCTLGLSEELKCCGIAVNSLWPEFIIDTAAIANMPNGKEMTRYSRKPAIMAEAAHWILRQKACKVSGNFFIDSEILKNNGQDDLSSYAVNPDLELIRDIFLD